jgi:phosphoglycerol transferase MdoB-like AlkP superfamily enzyme
MTQPPLKKESLDRLAALKSACRYFKAYPVCIVILIFQLTFTGLAIFDRSLHIRDKAFVKIYVLGLTAISVIVSFFLISWLISKIKLRALRFNLNVFIFLAYILLILYEFNRGSKLDVNLIRFNYAELASYWGFLAIIKEITFTYLLAASIFFVILVYLQMKWQFFSATPPRPKKRYLALATLFFSLIFFFFEQDQNQFNALVKSIFRGYRMPELYRADLFEDLEEFPYLNITTDSADTLPGERPHIFFILVESFNKSVVDAKMSDGRAITPFFNELKKEGVYLENFYSNSVQSARGYVASLCSVIPSFRHMILTHYADLSLHCLPKQLQMEGYETFVTLGMDGTFNNMKAFLESNGIEKVLSIKREDLPKEKQKYFWGWGLQDDIFYKEGFEKILANRQTNKPIFGVFLTVSSHHDFNHIPVELRSFFAKPKNKKEAYYNSIHFADQSLRSFFEELERHKISRNSLVVIFGDHGYPVGAFGNTSNEITIYNDLFEVPILFWWPERIKPKTISDCKYSQIDIPPTIKDFLNIRSFHHDAGRPISLNGDCSQSVGIPLIQPYDGGKIATLVSPFKLVWNLSSGEKILFNIRDDPQETTNLWGQPLPPTILERLESGMRQIILNQKLIEEDRIFPRASWFDWVLPEKAGPSSFQN